MKNEYVKSEIYVFDLLSVAYLQRVPEGECEGAGGLIDWVVSRHARTKQNHVHQSKIILPVV